MRCRSCGDTWHLIPLFVILLCSDTRCYLRVRLSLKCINSGGHELWLFKKCRRGPGDRVRGHWPKVTRKFSLVWVWMALGTAESREGRDAIWRRSAQCPPRRWLILIAVLESDVTFYVMGDTILFLYIYTYIFTCDIAVGHCRHRCMKSLLDFLTHDTWYFYITL